MAIARTGINGIDALISKNYWGNTGQPITLSYTIRQAGPNSLSATQTDLVREALRQWSRVANITFVEGGTGPDIAIAGQRGGGGLSSPNLDWDWWNPGSWTTQRFRTVDVTIGTGLSNGRGGTFLATALHEIGHALGLSHPGNYNGATDTWYGPYLPYQEDNNTNTVMTYNRAGRFAATPMAYDIRAIQHIFGARALNAGDTRYRFETVYGYHDGTRFEGSATTPLKMSIWDSGGTDTLDFSNLARLETGAYQFDIAQGGILTELSAYNASSYVPVDNGRSDLPPIETTSTFGTTIAFNTVIENVVGSDSRDIIRGNAHSNRIEGGAGNDDIYSFGGRDSLYGNEGRDQIHGGDDDDYIYGGSDADVLYGDAGNDSVNGEQGSDLLYGGIGHDVLTGGTENDFLFGEDGSDRLYGQDGNDLLSGGDGNDYLQGGAGDDRLNGNDGDDVLDGGIDFDTMKGGKGDDRYYVDSRSDRVIENANEGTDTVVSSVNYTLSSHVEELVLSGTRATRGIGNNKSNTITGGSNDNYLYGEGGHDYLLGGYGIDALFGGVGFDRLNGGAGNDRLTGGSGVDTFEFDSIHTGGIDTITDFTNGSWGDRIKILTSGFGGGLSRGALRADQFVLGARAIDRTDRFIFNESTRGLYFDADGSGSLEAVQFATISGTSSLSHTDFYLG